MSETEEDCQPCKLNISAGMALSVCDVVFKPKGVDCEQIQKDLEAGKITELDVIDKVIALSDEYHEPDVKLDVQYYRELATKPLNETPEDPKAEVAPA